jgi:hypothetical protein
MQVERYIYRRTIGDFIQRNYYKVRLRRGLRYRAA